MAGTAIGFSCRHKRDVYVAFTDRTVRAYDVETAQLLATLKGHHTPVYSIAVHPTQDALVTCSSDSVLMWDAQVRPSPARHPRLPGLSAFATHRNVLGASGNPVVRMWVIPPSCGSRAFSSSSLGRVCRLPTAPLACVVGELTTRGWSQKWERKRTLGASSYGAVAAAFVPPAGCAVATAFRDDSLWVWDASSFALLAKLSFPLQGASAAGPLAAHFAIANDGVHLVAVGESGSRVTHPNTCDLTRSQVHACAILCSYTCPPATPI